MGKPFFLSRLYRFGKSLLVSTLEAYFQGRKELFEGLAIEKLEDKWENYPVLHLELNARKYECTEDLIAILNQFLENWESIYGTEKQDRAPEERLGYIIQRAYEQTGKGVVVLVDEYDKPLLQAIHNEELLEAYRVILKAFYGTLKSKDSCLRFVFLTGVTKFLQVSVSSDLNQLNDISMNKVYATICGLTKPELLDNFVPKLEALAEENDLSLEEIIETMTQQYDGYHFHQKADYDLRTLMDGVEASAIIFTEYRAEADNPIPLIYQSGYLTIKDFNKRFKVYTLGFPNDEVRYGFLNFLVPFYTPITDDKKSFYIGKFIRELESGDIDSFMQRFEAFFADFPYELNDKTERHYQVIVYLIFKLNGTAEEALQQIEEKGYAAPFKSDSRQLVKVGVEFSAETRNVKRWLVEQ